MSIELIEALAIGGAAMVMLGPSAAALHLYLGRRRARREAAALRAELDDLRKHR